MSFDPASEPAAEEPAAPRVDARSDLDRRMEGQVATSHLADLICEGPPPAEKGVCPYCGERFGFVGNFVVRLGGRRFHGCDSRRWRRHLRETLATWGSSMFERRK